MASRETWSRREAVANMDTREEKLRSLIVEHLSVERESVTLDATLNDLGADSLDTFELLIAIEKEFDIHFPDEDIAQVDTMRATLAYIDARAGGQ